MWNRPETARKEIACGLVSSSVLHQERETATGSESIEKMTKEKLVARPVPQDGRRRCVGGDELDIFSKPNHTSRDHKLELSKNSIPSPPVYRIFLLHGSEEGS